MLDLVRFLPMSDENAFGFVDPTDVLRACHIVPQYAGKKLHSDGISLSRCVRGAHDWREYFVNRYAAIHTIAYLLIRGIDSLIMTWSCGIIGV
jgi:hypothetical protein